jgi:hypothetical protein
MKDITKPIDLAAGRLETSTGTCKYCGNLVAIKADPGSTEEERNAIASSECGCKDAQKAAGADASIRVMTENIEKRYADMKDPARQLLIASLRPVAYGYIDKVSVKANDRVSFKIFRSKEGLKCTHTIKEDDTINEWPQG